MAVIYRDELVAAMNFSTFSALEADIQEANQMRQSIDNFVSTSTTSLRGEEWNTARGKLELFSNALSVRATTANNLSSSIQGALKTLIDYMEEYEMLDSSKLGEIKALRSKSLGSIANLRAMLAQADSEDTNYTSADINSQISILEGKIAEMDKLIKKLDGLDGVYESAAGMINGALGDVQNFASSVSQITPSASVVYSRA